MADKIVLAYPPNPHASGIFKVLVDGEEVGQVYQDAPGKWVIRSDAPTFETIAEAVRELLRRSDGRAK